MIELFQSLSVGLVALAGVTGVGLLALKVFGTKPLFIHWDAILAILSGMAITSTLVQSMAMAGSSRTTLRHLGVAIVAAGLLGHLLCRTVYAGRSLPKRIPIKTWPLGLISAPVVLMTLIAIAPSTKIDELYYHMLIGRRIVEDQGLRAYQLPFEQAIVPQVGYQIAESVFHAVGTPDAGNILSLFFATALLILIYGVVAEQSGNSMAGLLTAATCATGLYPAVWHVTAGPHALGDLATATAVAALVFPGALDDPARPRTRSILCALASALAASTKISLVPICLLITLAALFDPKLQGIRTRAVAAACGIWFLVHGPLVLWTFIHTGSPFGVVFAKLFGSTTYQPVVFKVMANTRIANQLGLLPALQAMFTSLNGGILLLLVAGLWSCVSHANRLGVLLGLVVIQYVLIAWALPHDFRFFGGLQYPVLMAGAMSIAPRLKSRGSKRWLGAGIAILVAPWLAAETYYAIPFMAVDFGVASRPAFLGRYVAFMEDFRNLDRILSRNAKLYVPNIRMPALYAPRPVLFTLADWNQQTPLYRLVVLPPDGGTWTPVEPQDGLVCGAEIYHNNHAAVTTFRTPGRASEYGIAIVQECYPARQSQDR